jgi:hypothetical protein
MPASLRSDGVRDHPGMPFGFIPDLAFGFVGIPNEFRFNSPLDDHIDKTTYMKKCWPNSEQIEAYHFETLVAAEPNKVVSRYTVDWKADRSFKFPCMECIELEGGKIKRIDCYFGFVPKDELSL